MSANPPVKKTSLALIISSICAFSASAETDSDSHTVTVKPSQMVQGGNGLIQTPTARMREEGGFAANYTDNGEYRFFSVNLQLFDWMEATARYTDVRTRLYSDVESFSGDQTLKDKGLDVKFRLWKESYYLPDISVGFRDFGGTGFFESEYINASKSFGPVDVHLGLGWGYLGTASDITNPFCELRESFCERPTGFSGRGGKVDYQQFFKGDVAFFGGIEYQTPWAPLTLKLEFEGNDYSRDRAGELQQDTRWNVGAVYRLENLDVSLNYQRGNTVGFGFTYRFNMNTISQVKFDKPPRSLLARNAPETVEDVDKSRLYNSLYRSGGLALTSAKITENEATFFGTQYAYRDQHEAIERVGRIVASELPDSVKTYHIVDNSGGLPMVDTEIDASAFISAARYESLENDLSSTYTRQAPSQRTRESYDGSNIQGLFYNADFFFTQSFGNPEDFYLYQTGLILGGGYAVNNKLSFITSARVSLLDNFDKFNYLVDNEEVALPRVRTRVREYISENPIGLDTAFVHYKDRVSDDVFGQVYGGYLESMFAGVGGELLYRPVDSRLAYGIDINYVKQRDPYSKLDTIDYEAITGHASVYYRPEFLDDTQITASVGQFLAKDKGVNIDFAKRFDSGIIVGAYAAFTDVSSEEYGEGSFTKGFYISIPSDLFLLQPSTGRGNFPWVPISRDGGQMLRRPIRLIDTTEVRSPFYD
ncbi:YjbH domain-containing protein [Alteromonas sp. 345S023]|uniref:YjbH domain-containing protein n=1 Tax=Alteromonas profundi TaxID=2696062 RepID=A0A7X5LJJ5_9ALTE|nr:YjbH domain-containing protein [Alteromonas profundi]NDV90532.1 YjbH domain-containing protein [Alteromonas profundi]